MYINLSSSLLFWSQPNTSIDLDWALHQPNFASCFHLEKNGQDFSCELKTCEGSINFLAKESLTPPPEKKKLTSTKNIHLEIKLSRLMFYNNLITSPQSLVFPFCLKKKIHRFSLKTRGHRGTPGAPWRVSVSCVVGAAWGVRRCQNGRPNLGPWKTAETGWLRQVGRLILAVFVGEITGKIGGESCMFISCNVCDITIWQYIIHDTNTYHIKRYCMLVHLDCAPSNSWPKKSEL